MTSGLRKRARGYLHVPSATVADERLSFKARGILLYLLDKPPGWDVRSVSLAAGSPDGKAAVQAGLRELARAGYYRIERRRLLDGRLVTGTAVSEEPVASWAAEYAEYEGPVPVVQMPGGGFKVRHQDGSLTSDGFTDPGPEPPVPEPPAAGSVDGDSDVAAGHTGTQFSGAGSAGAGQTGAGSPGAGKPGAIITTEEPLQTATTEEPVQTTFPSPQPPSGAPWPGARPGLDALIAEVRTIRPEWSSSSVRRALAHPDVAERGWDRARRAMLAVAADPGSKQPGRLPHDGPWWDRTQRPPWCGECDEVTRLLDYYEGDAPRLCPRCKPPRGAVVPIGVTATTIGALAGHSRLGATGPAQLQG